MKGDKVRLVKLLEILYKQSDSEHSLGTPELLEKLAEAECSCDRRTLYDDIKTLNDAGYEIMCERSSSNRYYYEERDFNMSELHILMDAVQAASFISPKKTEVLVDKIAQLAGAGKGALLKKNVVAFNTTKSSNEEIYYAVNEITLAIEQGKKIEFCYFDYGINNEIIFRKNRERYVVNPVATVFSDDRYYLICYGDKHSGIVHYRIDRMSQVSMIDTPITPNSLARSFDVSRHKRGVFDMFGGEEKWVKFRITPDKIGIVHDKFGERVACKKTDSGIEFEGLVQVSPTFLAWCCSLGKDLAVLEPVDVREQVKSYIQTLGEIYKD